MRELNPSDLIGWQKRKADLVEQDIRMDFSTGVNLTFEEIMTEKKLDALRAKMLDEDPTLLTNSFQSKIPKILGSDLFKCLYKMPKPGIHHLHMTATVSVEFLLELTYDWRVYFSERENLFKVSANPDFKQEGYMKVNTLRQYWKNADEFDKYLMDKMRLRPHTTHREDHKIWESFQHKFSLTFELYNYKHFFIKCLYRAMKEYIREMSTIVEIRHVFGCLFDDNGPVSLAEEIKIFHDMQRNIQNFVPLFQIRLISVGLKIFGRQ